MVRLLKKRLLYKLLTVNCFCFLMLEVYFSLLKGLQARLNQAGNFISGQAMISLYAVFYCCCCCCLFVGFMERTPARMVRRPREGGVAPSVRIDHSVEFARVPAELSRLSEPARSHQPEGFLLTTK